MTNENNDFGSMKDVVSRDDPRKSSNLERVTTVEDLEKKSWHRDAIKQRYEDVKNAHNNYVNIIRDIQQQIDGLRSREDLDDQYSNFYDKQSKLPNGNPKYRPDDAYQEAWKWRDLIQRENRWITELMDLHRFAARKFMQLGVRMLEEIRTSKVDQRLDEQLDERLEHKVNAKFSSVETEIVQHKNDIERVAQAIREERRALDTRLESFAESQGQVFERKKVLDVLEQGLEQFVVDDGLGFSTDSGELSDRKDRKGKDEAAESSVDELVDDSDEDFEIDKDKLTDKQVSFLESALELEDTNPDYDLDDLADEADLDLGNASKMVKDIRKKDHELPENLKKLG